MTAFIVPFLVGLAEYIEADFRCWGASTAPRHASNSGAGLFPEPRKARRVA